MYRDEHLLIGAGPVGLAMARELSSRGVRFRHVDASDGVGGNWYHGVYSTAHIISSKKTTEFPEYPMPPDYPDFPSAGQMLTYLRSYAEHFGLTKRIELGKKVTALEPIAGGERWRVRFQDGEVVEHKSALVCNGHHWDKRWPRLEGEFTGEKVHSKDYKDPEQLRNKRVLVIGGGNSACDVASEAARVGRETHLSQRRGYWVLPKTVFGIPSAELLRPYLPPSVQRAVIKAMLRIVVGEYEQYGLKSPEHDIFAQHPTVNSELLHYLKHGRIRVHPDVRRVDQRTVEFVDGQKVEVDLIVCATGFHVAFPFLPAGMVDVKGAVPAVYGGSALASYRNIHLIGWAQPRYGFGPLCGTMTKLIADMLEIEPRLDRPIGALLRDLGDRPPATHLLDPHDALRRMRVLIRLLPYFPMIERMISPFRPAAPAAARPSAKAPEKVVERAQAQG